MSRLSVDEIRRRINRENDFLKRLGKDWLTKDEQRKRNKYVGGTITNSMRSRLEIHDILTEKPNEIYVYVDVKQKALVTFIGEKIADITAFTKPYRSQKGDVRTNIKTIIDDTPYTGVYFISDGNFAILKKVKG